MQPDRIWSIHFGEIEIQGLSPGTRGRKHLSLDIGAQFIKFAGVGAIGTLAHYLTLVTLVGLGRVDPVLASVMGSIVGAIINYTLNYRWTFNSAERHAIAVPKFFSVMSVGLLLNACFMYVLVSMFHVYYLAAQIVVTGIILGWNFLGNRLWTFRNDVPVRLPQDAEEACGPEHRVTTGR